MENEEENIKETQREEDIDKADDLVIELGVESCAEENHCRKTAEDVFAEFHGDGLSSVRIKTREDGIIYV